MRIDIPSQLAEIEVRNRLRAECKLPPLDRTYEIHRLRRLLELEYEAAFNTWADVTGLRARIEEKALAR
jgi:hypothetical protein